ncbi:ABC transporter ATP-binding protein [Amycolatopsis sp.]|jgi:ABC-type Fe3+/spermidine/putrescine transport system ATPase subunit|uniref:ABC transporter ATP-binding protein n=1 Tax=Amycolatopsis sp. TaxID=37632 RepID=UPI002E0BB3C4|nr:ABC transporter ATP-binding protein [Amycolatopsis sp.]
MTSTNEVSASRLEINDVVKRYGAHTALDGVSLTAEAGEFVVLLGPSGSGKSTLLRVVAGIEGVDEGRVLLGNALVADRRSHVPPEQRGLAMVFQDYALWPHLTVADNVAYPLRRKRVGRREAVDRVGGALERVGLAGYEKRYPSELSGGEQQRVALARALVGRPGLLLFDEPLSNLDADLRERLRVEIATLARESGATAVYITHDQAEAFALADVIGVLDQGRLVQFDRPETIYRHPANPFVARFTGLAGELAGQVTRVDGEFVVLDDGEQRLRARAVGRLAAGDPARLLVRPAATRILPAGSPGDGLLAGTVVDVAYRGRGYDHVVAVRNGTLSSVFGEQAWSRGTEVHVALDPEGCIAHGDPALIG